MDYKEAYYSLIERLKKAKEDDALCDERYCCVIDGLIQEQEKDESIREVLISYFKNYREVTFNGISTYNILSWLEKQGQEDPCKDCKYPMLNCHNFPCSKKQKYQGKSALEAIKEEKVDNANKVEQNTFLQKCFNAEYERGKNDAVAWSEEDKKMFRSLHNLIYVVRDCDCDSMEKDELSDWLESLKDRVQPKQRQEWNKEDEKCARLSTDIIDSALRAGFCVQLDRDRCIDWIKSLKERVV